MSAELMLKSYAELVESPLQSILNDYEGVPDILKEAMSYSLNAGGKRIRPAIMLEFYRVLGGNISDILNFACAVEMIHTYSLIHDDLPCMDDDDMRRGKPSCHIAFGEANALLAGDALLTLAFETAADVSSNIEPFRAVKAISALSNAAGMSGMIGGQVLDLDSEGKSITKEQLDAIHKGKTAALIKAPAQIACIIAGADEIHTNAAVNYCEYVGRAFQIRDDILDVISSEEVLGKPIGSDSAQHKNTYVSFVGLENAQKETQHLTEKALACLDAFDDTDDLRDLAILLATRNK